MRRFRYLDALTTAFVVILLVSNLVAQKVVRIGPISTSGAMLLFPITYIFGDIFTEIYGYAASRRAIWLGFFGTSLLYAVSALVIALPSDPEFHNQQAFVTVFGILPRILVASLAAFWGGEFANSYTMAKLKLITDLCHRCACRWRRRHGWPIGTDGREHASGTARQAWPGHGHR